MAGNGWIHNSKRGSRGPNEEGLTWGRPGSWVMVRSCCARFTSGRTRSYAGPVSFEPIAVSAIATAPAAARTAALADRRLAPLGRPAADGSARQCRWAASFIEFRDCQPAPRSLPRFRARRTTRIGTAHWQYPRSTLLVLPALREADDRSSVHSPSPPPRRLSDLLATGLLAPQSATVTIRATQGRVDRYGEIIAAPSERARAGAAAPLAAARIKSFGR